ncbi:MAG: DUF63 family protein [Methanobrevibacter sp.]|nr:DUF63 family protein [Methanobrevibacter sp.]
MATVDTFLPDFIQTTFFSGYTVFNTVIYTLILLLFIILIIKMFKKIEIDPISIMFPIIPFIFLGSLIRAFVDNGIYPKTVFLITPGLYILVGLATIASLLFSLYLYNKTRIDYRYTLAATGIILLIPNLILIPRLNFTAMLYVVVTWIISSSIFIILSYIIPFFKDRINLSIIMAHLFDASTTFIAVEYFNYSEQHVLANVLNQLFDTSLTMFPMKIIVIIAVLYIIDQYFDDETIKSLLKLTVFVLGLAPGLRNFLTLAIGTI